MFGTSLLSLSVFKHTYRHTNKPITPLAVPQPALVNIKHKHSKSVYARRKIIWFVCIWLNVGTFLISISHLEEQTNIIISRPQRKLEKWRFLYKDYSCIQVSEQSCPHVQQTQSQTAVWNEPCLEEISTKPNSVCLPMGGLCICFVYSSFRAKLQGIMLRGACVCMHLCILSLVHSITLITD